MKKKARENFNLICSTEDLETLQMERALEILLTSWDNLSEDTIRNSWNHLFIADDIADDPQDQNTSIAEAPEEEDSDDEDDLVDDWGDNGDEEWDE